MKPDAAAIEGALLEIFSRLESWGRPLKTSPTAVCEELAREGFQAGRWSRGTLRPDRDLMERVVDVAFAAKLVVRTHGNTTSIAAG